MPFKQGNKYVPNVLISVMLVIENEQYIVKITFMHFNYFPLFLKICMFAKFEVVLKPQWVHNVVIFFAKRLWK